MKAWGIQIRMLDRYMYQKYENIYVEVVGSNLAKPSTISLLLEKSLLGLSQLVASMSNVVLGGVFEVVSSNLDKGHLMHS